MICLLQNVSESKDRLRVGLIHFKPERLSVDQRSSGIMLDMAEADMPQAEERKGETPVLYCNPTTKVLWYEYVPRPLTQEEVLADVVARLDTVVALLEAQAARG